ncbi:type I-E CRISPR-associated protein Cas5/CasD [Sphingomonas sp. 2R-10]|uniref:type I-E CRISPR-associated protein Cas5/CasD n=1 Tax=Sphingomonas sp. 2R-10 TaxID=3045148 RepID=UPI0019D1B975|nr:type I-E CRISPR-associated protein Cas5/CasD [Sphingomonas sp. 2R-10]MDJ0278889.1 type I-E CRISPR-associated protein Cas5/CasD [Sphingomonas sp. 2R-10]
MKHLLLDCEAPLMSFGGDLVDAYGVVRDFPAKSMVAGLFANALGWERHDVDAHAALQARLTIGSARVREGRREREFQTAQLGANDRGWTTRGRVEGRAGGADTYKSPHIRYRDMDADARVLVACRLSPADDAPTLDMLAAALTRPERPLFLGRKPFVPSHPLLLGVVEANTIPEALALGFTKIKLPRPASIRAQWPFGEPTGSVVTHGTQTEELTDERHWPVGVHAGLRRVTVGRLDWPGVTP